MQALRVAAKAVLLVWCSASVGSAAAALPPASAVQGFIVKRVSAVAGAEIGSAADAVPLNLDTLSAMAGQPVQVMRQLSGHSSLVQLDHPVTADEAVAIAERMSTAPGVAYVSPNYRRFPASAPSDPRYSDQWYLHSSNYEPGSANVEDAWDITTGSSDNVIAVIDTGILSHADIDRILPGYDFWDITGITDNDGTPGRDNDPTDPGDAVVADECEAGASSAPSSWHGTLVSGVVSAAVDNGIGIAGIDQQARILPVRALGKCGGEDDDLIDAIRWAAGLSVPGAPTNANPAKIINMSLGGGGRCTAAFQEAINDVVAIGVTVVAAAGNYGVDVEYIAPANCNNVIAVAALGRDGGLASYSDYGSLIDISAPGGEILDLSPDRILTTSDSGTAGPANDDSYEYVVGTSFAAPVVSGVVALMRALDPSLKPSTIELGMQAWSREFATGTSADCRTSLCGDGVVDAYEVVRAVRDNELFGHYKGGQKLQVIGDSGSSGAGLGWLFMAGLLLLAAYRHRHARR